MKKRSTLVTALIAFAAAGFLIAGEEVTKEGTMSCGKCYLKVAEKCSDTLKVKEGEEEVLYWLEEDGKQKTSAHKCSGTKPQKVTGTIEERDDKKFIVVKSFDS